MNLIDLTFTPIQYYVIFLMLIFVLYRSFLKRKWSNKSNTITLITFYNLMLLVPIYHFSMEGKVIPIVVIILGALTISYFLYDNYKRNLTNSEKENKE